MFQAEIFKFALKQLTLPKHMQNVPSVHLTCITATMESL